METFAGLGFTAGPVIGSVLYEIGGFQLPFFVLGAFLIIVTVLSYYIVAEIEGFFLLFTKSQNKIRIINYIKNFFQSFFKIILYF
jgi:MFS family permease